MTLPSRLYRKQEASPLASKKYFPRVAALGLGSPVQLRILRGGAAIRGKGHMGVQSISPGAVVSRVWEIYRDQFGVLVSTAVVLYALQFIIYLVLPAILGIVLV